MIVLAIETSCDETAIALIKKDKNFRILSNVVASQVEIHKPFGGVYPTLAKREHQKNLVPVLREVLRKAEMLQRTSSFHNLEIKNRRFQKLERILKGERKLLKRIKRFFEEYKRPEIEAIAVTIGPGLEPCLWVGVNFAKALGYFWKFPLIPINHLEGHIFANFINLQGPTSDLFPAISLIISGGHTQLVLMKDLRKYKIIGETRDDAAGECFDKTARILGLSYPGGPEIERQAFQSKSKPKYQKFKKIKLPRPMIHQENYDFSFSGLKTAVLYDFKKREEKERKLKTYVQKMAHEIQEAICDVLIEKTKRAAREFRAKTIILGGGVAANIELRKRLKVYSSASKLKFLVPPKKFCTDNAAMIGITAFYHLDEKRDWKEIKAKANLRL